MLLCQSLTFNQSCNANSLAYFVAVPVMKKKLTPSVSAVKISQSLMQKEVGYIAFVSGRFLG